jgi:hypothetical protein
MLTFRKSLGDTSTTTRAILGSAVWVNRHIQSTSFCGFVLQHMQELCPSGVSHTLAHVAATQPHDVQILYDDEGMLPYQAVRQLVLKVPALVGHPLMQSPDLAAQFPVATAAPSVAGALALEQGQMFLGLSEPTRVLDHLAGGEGGEVYQAHVDPDGWSGSEGDVDVGQFHLKHDIPVADAVPLEDRHLDRAVVGNRAVLEQAHEAHVLYIYSAILEPDAVSVDVADRLEPATTFEAWVAGCLAGLDATEEGLKGFVETAERLLERGEVAPGDVVIEGTNVLELVGLANVADADTAALPGVPSLLEGSVVHLAVDLQDAVERMALIAIRVQAVLVAQQHLSFPLLPTPSLRLNVASDCLGRYFPGSANVIGSSPQRRQALLQPRELAAECVGCIAFEVMHDLTNSQDRRKLGEEMHVVLLYLQGNNLSLQLSHLGTKQLIQSLRHRIGEHPVSVLWTPDQVVGHVVDSVSSSLAFHSLIVAQMFDVVKLGLRRRKEERHSPPR